MQDKRINDLHVHVCDEADAMLDLLATATNKPRNLVAAELIERAILGECYALKVAALRLARAGFSGTTRD